MGNMLGDVVVIGKSGQLARCLQDAGSDEYVFFGRPEFDIKNNEHLKWLFSEYSPKVVINASAYTAVDRAEVEQQEAYLVNSEAVKCLAIKCAQSQAALIHISTDYVFDGASKHPYKVADKTSPQSVYGVSKLQGEEHIKALLDEHLIIRTSWVFSKYGNNFVKTMLRLAGTMDEISVVNDQFGAPTSAHNLAQVIAGITETILRGSRQAIPFGTYHYTDAPVTNWHEFAKEIFSIVADLGAEKIPTLKAISSAEYEAKMQGSATCAKRPENSVLDVSLLCENFGIKQQDWRKSLREVVAESIVDNGRKIL